jgi:hypothetical protein
MNRHAQLAVLTSLLLLAFSSASAAVPAQKVVFVGDQVTSNWPVTQTNPNWINQGQSGAGSEAVAASFQTAINQHPNVIHIMVGLVDFQGDTGENPPGVPNTTTTNVLSALQTMVQEARAANIQVIFGLEPLGSTTVGAGPTVTNAVVAAYGAQQGIPVISYQNVDTAFVPPNLGQLPTAAFGYAEMTALLENVLPTLGLQLGGGYLQNSGYTGYPYAVLKTNMNNVPIGTGWAFTAVGWFNNNPTLQQQLNTNILGANGTWTSSNPLVMVINQQGGAYALTPGTTTIRYTSLSGVAFSEWVMTVGM